MSRIMYNSYEEVLLYFYLDPWDLREYVGGSGGPWKVGRENDEI